MRDGVQERAHGQVLRRGVGEHGRLDLGLGVGHLHEPHARKRVPLAIDAGSSAVPPPAATLSSTDSTRGSEAATRPGDSPASLKSASTVS